MPICSSYIKVSIIKIFNKSIYFSGDTNATGSEKGLRTWVKRSNLVDSRTSVTDVKFGPKHLGLLLVTCSADGIIRYLIYYLLFCLFKEVIETHLFLGLTKQS